MRQEIWDKMTPWQKTIMAPAPPPAPPIIQINEHLLYTGIFIIFCLSMALVDAIMY